MSDPDRRPITEDELAAEEATALPDKEVVSLLDLDANIDLAINAAAPIDLAVAANANVAAPIDAAVAANVLSVDSSAQALADQGAMITQGIVGDATANSVQDSSIEQGDGTTTEEPTGGETPTSGTTTATPTLDGALSGPLLDIDVDVMADADLAAPINGAVAANANVAAPIDAAVAANVGSISSDATAIADQDVIIDQSIEGDSTATADQESDIGQTP
jgi:hypothetical protein